MAASLGSLVLSFTHASMGTAEGTIVGARERSAEGTEEGLNDWFLPSHRLGT